ncbi:MAG: Sua5/YciO/YrdC/YwlC family protein, partial [Clostridiales bacterium]
FCWINEQEQALLQSRRRPIVLLRKRMDAAPLAAEIAPHNGRLGVMLPYTPLHHLLLRGLTALVMTSGNVTDEPIAYEDQDAVQRLAGIADCFLTHNRPIFRRCDDSVAIWAAGFPRLYRRSRGYTPEPLRLVGGCDLLAVGGEQKNTFCLVRGEDAFLSQHIGDLDEVNTYDGYRREIADFCRMFEVKPRLLAHDLHPQYLSTIYAKEYAEKQDNPLTLCPVQHHHAHLASVLAEH